MSPGVYPSMPLAEYLRAPAVSASLLNTVNERCPAAAWHASWLNPHATDIATEGMDAGSIAHAIVLEGSRDGIVVIDRYDHPAEKTGNIPDGWTNKSIRAARDAAREAGKIPVLLDDMIEINAMASAAQRYIDSLRLTEPAIWRAFQEGSTGVSELSLFWDDDGVLCRARPDRLDDLCVDLKFTSKSAEPATWARGHMDYLRAAHYRAGARAALLDDDLAYVYLVVEASAPYLCSLVGLDPMANAIGEAQRKAAMQTWRECVRLNQWLGYPTRVCYPEVPPWEFARWTEE